MATNDTTVRPGAPSAPDAEQPASDGATRPAASAAAPAPRARARAPRARRASRARRAGARRPARRTARRGATARGAGARTRVGTTVEPVATTPVTQAQQLAERAVLIPLGAALEARDRVVGALDELVSATTSRRALDRQLKRFERRGGKARTELEHELRRTRTRVEREVRHGRTRVEQQAHGARRGLERQRGEARRALRLDPDVLQERFGPVRSRVEDVVQNGVNAGRRLVGDAQGRIAKAV